VSAADHRTVGELLADSDELARETLLDATPDQVLATVRSWSQLVGSAAERGRSCLRRRTARRNWIQWNCCGRSGRRSAAASPPDTGPGRGRPTNT
jgi:hypothetical protein